MPQLNRAETGVTGDGSSDTVHTESLAAGGRVGQLITKELLEGMINKQLVDILAGDGDEEVTKLREKVIDLKQVGIDVKERLAALQIQASGVTHLATRVSQSLVYSPGDKKCPITPTRLFRSVGLQVKPGELGGSKNSSRITAQNICASSRRGSVQIIGVSNPGGSPPQKSVTASTPGRSTSQKSVCVSTHGASVSEEDVSFTRPGRSVTNINRLNIKK